MDFYVKVLMAIPILCCFLSTVGQAQDIDYQWGIGFESSFEMSRVAVGSERLIAGDFKDALYFRDTVISSHGEDDVFFLNTDKNFSPEAIWSFGAGSIERSLGHHMWRDTVISLIEFWDSTGWDDTNVEAKKRPINYLVLLHDGQGVIYGHHHVYSSSRLVFSDLSFASEGIFVGVSATDTLHIDDTAYPNSGAYFKWNIIKMEIRAMASISGDVRQIRMHQRDDVWTHWIEIVGEITTPEGAERSGTAFTDLVVLKEENETATDILRLSSLFDVRLVDHYSDDINQYILVSFTTFLRSREGFEMSGLNTEPRYGLVRFDGMNFQQEGSEVLSFDNTDIRDFYINDTCFVYGGVDVSSGDAIVWGCGEMTKLEADGLAVLLEFLNSEETRRYAFIESVGAMGSLGDAVEKRGRSHLHLIAIDDKATSGLDVIVDPEVTLYPNPASDNFNISGIEWNKLEILDTQQKLVQVFMPSDSLQIDHLSPGLYLLRIHADERKVHVRSLIIQ